VSDQAHAAGGGTQEIRFDNGYRAAVVVDDGAGPRDLVSRLGLLTDAGRRPVMVVCGGANSLTGAALDRARAVLGPVVAAAARVTGAAVVDGGTAAGVVAVLGAARAEQRSALPALIGVAPVGTTTYPGGPVGDERVPLEPHHTHFVLADGAGWGSETGLLFGVVEALAAGGPIAMVLGGGGAVAKTEALESVRRGWPVFVLSGTGGLADSVAALWQAHRVPRRRRLAPLLPRRYRYHQPTASSAIPDLGLREIVRDGDVRLVRDVEPDGPARQLAWELQDEPVLKQAWQSFATYDQLAAHLRRTFERFQSSILVLGILATLLALVHQRWSNRALHWSVVAIPILASVLIALANRRATGKRWVLLRAAAEAIKTEIYRYRTGTGAYADQPPPRDGAAARRETLARQLEAIDARLMHTEASSGPLTPYEGPLPPQMYGASRYDDGLSPLDSSRYLATRVADQLSYYHGRIGKLERSRNSYQLLAIASAGAGALLAAAGAEIWIGLTTTISVAATAYLANLQLDNTIVAYNQSANKLSGLLREWSSRTANGPARAPFEDLVARGEAVLTTELSGWVQQMNDALRQLQENHTKPDTEKATTAYPRR